MARQISVTIEESEFAEKFPEIAKMDLSASDQIRVALGLEPRNKTAGAPKHNKNAVGNAGRWKKKDENRA